MVSSSYRATTATSFPVKVGSCSNASVPAFGKSRLQMNCSGHTPGYWASKHGLRYICKNNMLARLNAMACLRNPNGSLVRFRSIYHFRCWVRGGSARNMAYKLSVHWAAMFLNIQRGFVSRFCHVKTRCGTKSIARVMIRACLALKYHGRTCRRSRARTRQERLKNILDDANNNRNWAH